LLLDMLRHPQLVEVHEWHSDVVIARKQKRKSHSNFLTFCDLSILPLLKVVSTLHASEGKLLSHKRRKWG